MVRAPRASTTGEAEAKGSKVSGQPVLHIESLFQNNNSKEKQEERESGDQRGHQEGTNSQVQIVTGAVVSAKKEVPWGQVSESVTRVCHVPYEA